MSSCWVLPAICDTAAGSCPPYAQMPCMFGKFCFGAGKTFKGKLKLTNVAEDHEGSFEMSLSWEVPWCRDILGWRDIPLMCGMTYMVFHGSLAACRLHGILEMHPWHAMNACTAGHGTRARLGHPHLRPNMLWQGKKPPSGSTTEKALVAAVDAR